MRNNNTKNSPKAKIISLITFLVLVAVIWFAREYILPDIENDKSTEYTSNEKNHTGASEDDFLQNGDTGNDTATNGADETVTIEATPVQKKGFRNQKLLDSHYEEHGIEMGFDSAKDYEKAAIAVVNNKNALHRIEQEDGDDVYYVEATNEFVVVSKDGYIRTYFNPSDGKDYFERQ